MNSPVLLAAFTQVETLGAALLAALVTAGIARWLHGRSISQLTLQMEREKGNWQTAMEHEKAISAKQATLALKTLADAKAECAVVEERFALHREAAQRRENDSLARIGSLEADLATTRELAAKLPSTQARIGDLEKTLTAERGRIQALEQALSVTRTRAQEIEQKLDDTQSRFTQHQEKAQTREADLVQQLAEREQSLASDQARLSTVDEEISRLKENHTSYQTSAEARITSLQRQLAAAEAKSALVQKEFMSAVGVLPEPSAAAVAAPNDKRIIELEAKITQTEAEARKKAREDGYKIAELEYRLSEASEAAAKLKATEGQAAEIEKLLAEVKSLIAEKDMLTHDLETLKLVKAKSVEPVPEVMEQAFLIMDEPAKES
ncbi:hypothetical protein [Prosthecobacter fusiformis]|nr:hypothetical protein [Prosthecobacter fusiformis]